jgi:hypothetical protein
LDTDDERPGVVEIELTTLRDSSTQLTSLFQPLQSAHVPFVYDMDQHVERLQLAADLWTQPFDDSLAALRSENGPFVAVLEAQIANQSRLTASLVVSKSLLVDGILMDVCRAQSQKKMPLLTAALGVLGEAHRVRREYHDWISMYHKGAAPSEKWVQDIIILARDLRPPPTPHTVHAALCTFHSCRGSGVHSALSALRFLSTWFAFALSALPFGSTQSAECALFFRKPHFCRLCHQKSAVVTPRPFHISPCHTQNS